MTRHQPNEAANRYASDKDAASEIVALLADPDFHRAAMIFAVASMAVVPVTWLVAAPLGIIYVIWYWCRRYRLPFRLPMQWRGPDYSNPLPGHERRFRKSLGMLYLGNDAKTGEELWLSNSDARRHALVLGTTGAGKALPDDTLILTPKGWRPNGKLRPGDHVVTPHGTHARVCSVHPQGDLPLVRMHFSDGRCAECSRDHLWPVTIRTRDDLSCSDSGDQWRLRTAADIGIQFHLGNAGDSRNPKLRLFLPLVRPASGPLPGDWLCDRAAQICADHGLGALSFMPSLAGQPLERRNWTGRILADRQLHPRDHELEIPIFDESDGFRLRQLVWSLGGTAIQIACGNRLVVRAAFPGQQDVLPGIAPCCETALQHGLEIIDVDGGISVFSGGQHRPRRDGRQALPPDDHGTEAVRRPMRCIRIDADDGLFVMEGYIVTHNTELLLGMAAQSLTWSSGFLFVDGKGTTEFHARAWSLARHFGRHDDYRILNFTDPGGSADRLHSKSNTTNPFSRGTADQLLNLIVSMMSGGGDDMWRSRAMALVAATIRALCEMRDSGDIFLDVQTIRDHLLLGQGPDRSLFGGRRLTDISQIPQRCWDEMRQRSGMIELYLRSLNGEFTEASRIALSGFFESLPGFSLMRAINGQPQEGRATEQYGFLAMQLTRPLGALADDFGHIFRTPVGEVDMDDVVLSRRILVVLLPALQKAPEEMRNCGTIVVAMLKMMMGRAAGTSIEGEWEQLVESRPTRSPSPFIAVLDEAGYYMVKGVDTMMAQARSLGFMMVIAGQDMASMQSVSPHIAETVAANARLTAAGALEDAQRTWEFLRRKFGTSRIPVASGMTPQAGWFGTKWVERRDATFVEAPRVAISDLQKLREGEFYFLMESTLVRAQAFSIGECGSERIAVNRFLVIRGPTDRGPDMDLSWQNLHARELANALAVIREPGRIERNIARHGQPPADRLQRAVDDELANARIPDRSSRPPGFSPGLHG